MIKKNEFNNLNTDNYSDVVLQLYDIVKEIDIKGFEYLTNLPKYFGDYENCYETFVMNFVENFVIKDDYKQYSKVINEILNRDSLLVVELIEILKVKFNSSNNTYYTFLLDMLDAIMFMNTEGYCLEEMNFLYEK